MGRRSHYHRPSWQRGPQVRVSGRHAGHGVIDVSEPVALPGRDLDLVARRPSAGVWDPELDRPPRCLPASRDSPANGGRARPPRRRHRRGTPCAAPPRAGSCATAPSPSARVRSAGTGPELVGVGRRRRAQRPLRAFRGRRRARHPCVAEVGRGPLWRRQSGRTSGPGGGDAAAARGQSGSRSIS